MQLLSSFFYEKNYKKIGRPENQTARTIKNTYLINTPDSADRLLLHSLAIQTTE